MATLAKGGRTNTLGFVLRLLGGLPFLFVGFRLYGVEEMGKFAAAFVVAGSFATCSTKTFYCREEGARLGHTRSSACFQGCFAEPP